MYLLGKVFKLRGKVHGEEDKPFLDHLEDLRIMITKVVLTLVLSTIICWVFHQNIIDVITKPVHEVWNSRQESKLPKDISIDHWEKVKRVRFAAAQLLPEQRPSFYQSFEDEKMQLRAESAGYYALALLIDDEEKRKNWVDNLSGTTEEHRELIHFFLEHQPEAEVDAKAKVVNMKSLKPTETFMLAFKMAFFAGVVVSFPLNLWFILQFILPGLKGNEKKIMWPAMSIGFGLFLAGVLFSYFIVLPRALDFFYEFGAGMGVDNEWRIGDYSTFVTQFTLIFGLAFELPVVVMTLVKLGLVGYQAMANTRSYAVLAIVVIAAAITPTSDILTLSMLAVPMYILYEICIILSYFDFKKQEREEEEEYQRTGVRKSAEVVTPVGLVEMVNDDEAKEVEEKEDDDEDDYDYSQEHDDEDYDYEKDHAEFGFDPDDYECDGGGMLDDDDYEDYDDDDPNAGSESEGDVGDSDSYEENQASQREEASEKQPNEKKAEEEEVESNKKSDSEEAPKKDD